jgi:hypothetical protein
LSFEHINQLIIDKKWQSIALEIESSLNDQNVDEETLIELFEKIPSDFRNDHCFNLNRQLWKLALQIGKIKLAKNYAQSAIDHLVKLKRFPFLQNFLAEVKSEGLHKIEDYTFEISLMQGTNSLEKMKVNDYWETLSIHPEKWKENKEFLKQYLMNIEYWNAEQWKLAYEFILNHQFDSAFLIHLHSKAEALSKYTHASKLATYLTKKNIQFPSKKSVSKKKSPEKEFTEKLKIDYDQLALEVISGGQQLSQDEQNRVLISLKNIPSEELKSKGMDMIIAFGLLGMEEVVSSLSERVIPLIDDVRTRASIHFVHVQSLFEKEHFYKVVDVIDDVLAAEPLLIDEITAFEYTKAEALLKTNRKKMAQAIFTRIKKQNPHYRLVGQRLKESEAS